MTETPLVSVVIMTCNRQNLLKNALEATFNQTYPAVEVITILGMNSQDMSEEMLTELRAKNMIKFNKNFGNRIDARNKGFEMATGKYVCFLDDDDSMLNSRIAKQVEYLEAHPEVDIVGCATMLNDKVGLMHTFKTMSSVDINNLLMAGVDIDEVLNFQSCMFRKESIEKAFGNTPKFDKLFIAGGEGQFFLYDCMFNHNLTCANISDTIYVYYVGQAQNSLSSRIDPVFYNEHIYGKTYTEKFDFVRSFRTAYPTSENATEKPAEIIAELPSEVVPEVVEKPKRTRKKKVEEVTTEAPSEKPKRGRKKKEAEVPATEVVTEKPKRTRKKKTE